MVMDKRVPNKIFILTLFGVFVFSLLISADLASASFLDNAASSARDYFGEFSTQLSNAEVLGGMGISYILSAVILIGAVYLFLSLLIKNKALALLVSFAAGVFLTILINPENMYAVFLSYESLLLSVLSIAPIIIVLFTNVKLLIDQPGKVWSRLGFKIIWWVWFVYLSWFGWRSYSDGSLTGSASIIVIIEIILIFLSAIGLLPKIISRYYRDEKNKAGVEAALKAGTSVSRAGKMGDAFADKIMGS